MIFRDVWLTGLSMELMPAQRWCPRRLDAWCPSFSYFNPIDWNFRLWNLNLQRGEGNKAVLCSLIFLIILETFDFTEFLHYLIKLAENLISKHHSTVTAYLHAPLLPFILAKGIKYKDLLTVLHFLILIQWNFRLALADCSAEKERTKNSLGTFMLFFLSGEGNKALSWSFILLF